MVKTRKRAYKVAAISEHEAETSETLPNQSSSKKKMTSRTKVAEPMSAQKTGAEADSINNNTDKHMATENTSAGVNFDELARKTPSISCSALESSVPFYYGTMSGCPTDWLEKYSRYGALKGWTSVLMAMAFPLYLKETASTWYTALDTAVKSSYDSLCTMFVVEFSQTRVHKMVELDALASRKQGHGETIDEYLADISRRCMRLGKSKDLEFEHALQGLQPSIKQQVLLQQAATLADIRRIGQLCQFINSDDRVACNSVNCADQADNSLKDIVTTLRAQIDRQQETINKLTEANDARGQQPAAVDHDGDRRPRQDNGRDSKCQWCGRFSCKGKSLDNRSKYCPAYNKTCYVCEKLHHFSKVCRNRKYVNKSKSAAGKPQGGASTATTRVDTEGTD